MTNLEKALGFKLEAFNYLYVLCDYETLIKKDISIDSFIAFSSLSISVFSQPEKTNNDIKIIPDNNSDNFLFIFFLQNFKFKCEPFTF